MNNRRGMLRGMAVLAVFLTALPFGCAKKEAKPALVSFAVGTVSLTRGAEAPRPVQMQEALQEGDRIETGKKSWLIIQMADDTVLRLEAETKAAFTALKTLEKREVSLEEGKLLSKLGKLRKGDEFQVKTPSALAAVRGTEFLTEYASGKTVVAVGEGKVQVVRTADSQAKDVEKGRAVVISDKLEEREVNKVETLELKKLAGTPAVKGLEKLKGDELKQKQQKTLEADTDINREIEELAGRKSMSLEEIRARYGRIDVVTLFSGKVIKGAILVREAKIKMITPQGMMSFPAKEVKRTD